MIRVVLIGMQLTALVLPGLAVSAFAVPFTSEGLMVVPSRLQAGLFLLAKMPFVGMPFLQSLRVLAWVPLITVFLALLLSLPFLRRLRWAGAILNLAGLVFFYSKLPVLASAEKLPFPLIFLAALFIGSTLILVFLPRREDVKNVDAAAVFFLFFFWATSVGILLFGASVHVMSLPALAGITGSLAVLSMVFYCLFRTVARNNASVPSALLLACAVGAVFGWLSPPLALPVAAGVILVLAARVV